MAVADTPIIHGLVTVMAAAAVGLVAAHMRPGEGSHFARLTQPALGVLAVPALWMMAQLSPMPFSALSHPIWASAAEALGVPITGHLTIDIGATLASLIQYLSAAAILLVAAAVTIERTRAARTLDALTAATAVAAAACVVLHFTGGAPDARPALEAASALGVIVAAAAIIKSIERYETRRTRTDMSSKRLAAVLAASIGALAVSAFAVLAAAPAPVNLAAGCGFGTVLLVTLARRIALGTYAAAILAAVAVVAVAAAVPATRSLPGHDPTLWFAAQSSPAAIAMADQMIADTAHGSGAGTFDGLAPIYRGSAGETATDGAPTTAAQLKIEMGRPAPWVAVLLALGTAAWLVRGALRRGRDSFYATAAAGAAITLTLEAFADGSLLRMAVAVPASAILGLGLAQSIGRSLE